MSNTTRDFLKHILNEINFLIIESDDLEYDEFQKSEKEKRAFARSIEIIGEAVKNLPPVIQEEYPDIEWRSIVGMRDRLIHGYFNIDYTLVWEVIQTRIPELKEQIENIIEDLEE